MSDDTRNRVSRLMPYSRFAMPLNEARAHVETHRKEMLSPPLQPAKAEPEFIEAAPFPVIDSPDAFAAAFWAAREKPAKSKTKLKARPKKNKSEPAENLPERPALRVIPGGKGDNEA